MIGESKARCIKACIGDMVDVFGADAVLEVARTMPHGTAGPSVVFRLTAAAPRFATCEPGERPRGPRERGSE
jgi:hypothetical protein